jgi:hypothetical protein
MSTELPAVGTSVRYIGQRFGEKRSNEKEYRYLSSDTVGVVISHHDGYPRHRCPDHSDAPDCVCGDYDGDEDRGWIRENPPWGVAEFDSEDGRGKVSRVADAENEGRTWERVNT